MGALKPILNQGIPVLIRGFLAARARSDLCIPFYWWIIEMWLV